MVLYAQKTSSCLLAPAAGGLLNEPRQGQKEGGVEMGRADTYGLPPRKQPGSILRSQVCALGQG